MADINLGEYSRAAATAVSDYRSGTNPHWNDSYLNMGAQLAQQAMENDYNLKLWNLNNEYNTPAAQMQRFKEAGLNPNLVYTQGTPGNSSSPAAASHANYTLSPQKDFQTQLQNVAGIIEMITNLAGNVSSMVSQGYDTALKRNELAWSNTEFARANYHITGFGDRNATPMYRVTGAGVGDDGTTISHFPSVLNPYSPDFSPLEYNTLMRLGKIPQFIQGEMTAQGNRRLTEFRSDYQKYYNDELLPLFKDYQEGKVSIQDLQRELLNYNYQALDALPPEVRGIMLPIMGILNLLLR